jgi:uncharacterized membrane protein YphA (DoxX/SURF4 family)
LFVYLGLYCLATPIAGGLILFPGFSFPGFGTLWPMRQVTLWLATNVFQVVPPIVYQGNSGDTAFHWIQTCWLLVAAVVASIVWSRLDRHRGEHAALHRWFRLFLRFAMAGQMLYFGMAKVVPTQFPPPPLVALVEPAGHLSLSDLLWTFIGASPAYQMFTGWAEVLAGALLVVPQTTLLGALLALADMTQVFVLNMSYDVGLKQHAFHLMVIALFLMAPDARRLADLFLRDRPSGPSPHVPLFATARANRRALVVQIAVGLYLAVMFTRLALVSWYNPGGPGAPKSPLYGIWEVEALSVDGQVRAPDLNDYDRRWRRVVFDAPDVVVFQRTDDSFAHYGAAVDAGRRSLVLRKGNSRNWNATFAFERPTEDRLILDGRMDEHTIHAVFQRRELDTFRLLNSHFRWVKPPDPYGG